MKDIRDRCVKFVTDEIRSDKFHNGVALSEDDWFERSIAEDKINRMTNLELLELIARVEDS